MMTRGLATCENQKNKKTPGKRPHLSGIFSLAFSHLCILIGHAPIILDRSEITRFPKGLRRSLIHLIPCHPLNMHGEITDFGLLEILVESVADL